MAKQVKIAKVKPDSYDSILSDVAKLLDAARRASARSVNYVMTATYWEIGRRIVLWEQGGKDRAEYGRQLMDHLADDLTQRFGRGFSRRAVYQMRAFYLSYPQIVQSPIAQSMSSQGTPIMQSVIAHSRSKFNLSGFPLPWTHYVRLLAVKDAAARHFYEAEALRGGWSARQLDRQISTLFYERTSLSRNKTAMLTKGAKARPEDAVTAVEEVKDPFVLEFLGLKDEYSEHDLEEGLIQHLESFLLELGGDFAFVGRQKRLRIGDEWYRIDLLFFHRRLRCLVIVDLKVGKLTHADAGQMHMYCNYAAEHWTHKGENPPVGLVLCARRDDAVAKYSLDNLPNRIMAAEYRLVLPDEKTLAAEVEKTHRLLQHKPVEETGD